MRGRFFTHWKRYTAAVLAGVALGLCVKFFVADIFRVSGVSMEPALREGSRIVVSKLSYGLAFPFSARLLVRWAAPRVNDVVIYLRDGKTVVKRCVAAEGDGLAFSRVKDAGGEGRGRDGGAAPEYGVTVNSRFFPLTEGQYQRFKHAASVPRGFIFAVGDNEALSVDSRQYGFVSVRNILGRVLCK
jgi:signal peptidase I